MNINNGKTGNVNIPGALHSTGGDGDGQVGGVVAYAGDVYDETLGKNQKEINQTLLDGSADSNVIAVALNDLNIKVEEQERVTSSSLNDLNDKVDNLSNEVDDNEKVTSTSLNDLNNKVDNLNEKVNDSELVTASSLADLDEKTDTNEKAVSAALNDLNDYNNAFNGRLSNLEGMCNYRFSSLESNQNNWVTQTTFNGLRNALKTVAFSGSFSDLTNKPFDIEYSTLRIGGTSGGPTSIALGSGSSASSYSVALGYNVQASTGWSAAFGSGTTAASAYTFVAGQNNTASGNGSAAFGIGMTASGSASFACGQYGYNTQGLSVVFKIGVGSNNSNRYNLIEICDFNNGSDDGAMYISGIGGYDGTNAKPSGSTPGADSL